MAKTKTAAAGEEKASRGKKAAVRPTLEKLQAEICSAAHEVYLKRVASGTPGDSLSDWLQAEAEVKKAYKL